MRACLCRYICATCYRRQFVILRPAAETNSKSSNSKHSIDSNRFVPAAAIGPHEQKKKVCFVYDVPVQLQVIFYRQKNNMCRVHRCASTWGGQTPLGGEAFSLYNNNTILCPVPPLPSYVAIRLCNVPPFRGGECTVSTGQSIMYKEIL